MTKSVSLLKKQLKMKISFKSKKLVYYGPHTCKRCKSDTPIVKAGNGAPESLEFDFVHGSHYPNHVWKKHKCIKKYEKPNKNR